MQDFHTAVLLKEALDYLKPVPGECMVDCTLGGGSHSRAIAELLQPDGTLVGIDRDPSAIEEAGRKLEEFSDRMRIILVQSAFGSLDNALNSVGISQIDGALFDFGLSSAQLDTDRGFSFRRDEKIDMRMSGRSGSEQSAAELLAEVDETELTRILWEYGEERWAKLISRRIVESREKGEKLETTGQLSAIIERTVPRSAWPKDINVSTRTFQGIRIAINDELGQIETGVRSAIKRLKLGGRIVVISYHSLESRILKSIFAELSGRMPSPPGSSPAAFLPNISKDNPDIEMLTRRPVTPSLTEIAQNPRSRSSQLRAAKRITVNS